MAAVQLELFAPVPAPLRRPVHMRTTALDLAGPQYRPALARLYDRWHRWNTDLFDGLLREPMLLVGLTSSARAAGVLATTGESARFDGVTVISFHGSLFVTQRRRSLRAFMLPERFKVPYQAGALLHEMVHQWELEVARTDVPMHPVHGPAFAAKANELAERLGLPTADRPSIWPAADGSQLVECEALR